MNKHLIISLSILLLVLSGGSTYAASTGSLWGDIDESVPSSKQIELQQKALQDKEIELQNQKTVCEILTQQPTLTGDVANMAKIQEELTRAYKLTLPEYQSLIANKEAANNLYKEYRNLYLSTYCTGVR